MGPKHAARVILGGYARLARVAVGRGRGDHIHEQRRVDVLVERDIAHGQRAQRLAVIAVGQRNEPSFRGLAAVAPEMEAHLHGHFHRCRTIVREEAARQSRWSQAKQGFGHIHRGFMGEAGENHMLEFFELPVYGSADRGIGMPEQIHPPGADGIQIAVTVHVLQPDTPAPAYGDERHLPLVILHLGTRMPYRGQVALCQRGEVVWRGCHAGIMILQAERYGAIMSNTKRLLASAAFAMALAIGLPGCSKEPASQGVLTPTGKLDTQRLLGVESEPGSWLTSGRDFGKTHYSPLELINQQNVGKLGFAWQYETGTARGMQATPVVIDGVMYASGVAGRAYALNAATGQLLWQFEPSVDYRVARGACCDLVNRGVAVWRGKVYVAALDGILYALNAADGQIVWQARTIEDTQRAYTSTGAPQVAGKVVIIGNGGSEFDSRGYVTAYDLETGKQAWRFYTVPGDPSKPFENKALENAAKTWHGTDWWKYGGGGSVWDSINYDPELNLVYFGTANGAPWNYTARSAKSGDNLFVASIVALNADTGDYVWHYQTTPGERWDYDATPHLMLTTLKLAGQDRKVLDAGVEEWLLLRDRPQDGRVALRRQVRRGELG